MTGFEWYLLFCLTTGMAAIYELLMPVVRQEIQQNQKVDNLVIITITFFIITTLIAPAVFISCISPNSGEKFRNSLHEGLFPKQ
jgi:hypothetical protein